MQHDRQNLEFTRVPDLSWQPAKRGDSMQTIADYVAREAEAAIRWYLRKKDAKRRLARGLRLAAIAATALAGLIPVLAQIYATDGKPDFAPAWASVALLVAAACVGLDRFFGYSTAWMRFLTTEMQIRHVLHEFLLDWETRRAVWQGMSDPGAQEAELGLKRCKEFLAQINGILKSEMDSWVTEFSAAIADIDKAAKAQVEVTRSGALSVTVTNGAQCPDGWRLSVDGGAEESHRGASAALRNLAPGTHAVAVVGYIGSQEKRAEEAFAIAAGQAASVELTLA